MTIGTKVLCAGLAAVAALAAVPATTQAADDDAKLRSLQQQIEDLSRQVEALRQEQARSAQAVPKAKEPEGSKGKEGKESLETRFDNFMKGFYGTLDASVDYTTKGMDGLVAYPYNYATGAPGSPYVISGPQKGPPFGKVGWVGAMSSNGTNIGYRGTHHIGKSGFDLIYQVSTSFDIVAAPGLNNTWTKSSNTVQGAIGLGDTYLGFQNKSWGKLKFGEMYAPYKTSTDRLNPFSGGLGNYSVVMGNTGGDNRVEFGTRMDHVVMYNSPTFAGVSFDAAYAFGQNLDPYNNITPLGSPDCSGANNPGSGNLPLSCDDGGFDDAYSADIKFEMHGLYLVAAYELHKRVNRSSDGIGANQPLYNFWLGEGPNGPDARYLNWNDYQALAAEAPGYAAVATPEYAPNYDTADEWAVKVGGQYSFEFGLTISALWEEMKRKLPAVMQFQDERQRNGTWLAIQQELNGGMDVFAIGWAHAGATTGDPGGQHNFNPNALGNNQANMYTVQWWHKLDKQLTFYVNAAKTINDQNAHFDIGAGGHGVKTDCHDASHFTFVDYSGAGPTTWGACQPFGVSTGVNYKF